MVGTKIQSEPIDIKTGKDIIKDAGAELIFWGHVREIEKGESIIGLEYEYYDEMASKTLHKIAESTVKRFNLKYLSCIHRVGFIPVGESSLFVQIWSKHRVSALRAMDWFISEIKKDVPIWKWGVKIDGTKFPSNYE